MKRAFVCTILCIALSSCASMKPQPRQVTLSSAFSPESVAWFSSAGTGSITGQSFIQTRGGQPRTCAGLKVGLLPQSKYGDERLTAIYGNTEAAFLSAPTRPVQFTPDSITYLQTNKTSVCDAQGNFSFTGLPAGNYVLISQIIWTVPGNYLPEGGALMRAVSINDGESKRVILTP